MTTIGFRQYIKTYKPWRNNKIKLLQRAVKKQKRTLEKLRIKHPDFYENVPKYIRLLSEYKSLLNHKTQTIKIAKKIYFDKINKIIQNSNFNDKLSWRLMKKSKTNSKQVSHIKS